MATKIKLTKYFPQRKFYGQQMLRVLYELVNLALTSYSVCTESCKELTGSITQSTFFLSFWTSLLRYAFKP